MKGDAGRVVLEFAGQESACRKFARCRRSAAVRRTSAASEASRAAKTIASGPQDFELTAPVIDFTVVERTHSAARGNLRCGADYSGSRPEQSQRDPAAPAQKTIVTAAKFEARLCRYRWQKSPRFASTARLMRASSTPRPGSPIASAPATRWMRRFSRRAASIPSRNRAMSSTPTASGRQTHAGMGERGSLHSCRPDAQS